MMVMSQIELPQVFEIEKGILGAILYERRLPDEVLEKLPTPEAFFSQKHKKIYSVMLELEGASEPVEVKAVDTLLRSRNGNSVLLTDLVELVDERLVTHLSQYASKIADRYRLRQLIMIANEAIKEAHGRQEEAVDVIDRVEKQVFSLAQTGLGIDNLQPMSQIVVAAFEEINIHQTGEAQTKYVQSGIEDLDRLLHGLKPGKYYLIAGRPSHGKSQLGIQVAYHAASAGYPVCFVSLEMPVDELGMRLLCTVSRVDSHLCQTKDGLNTFHWEKITKSQVKLFDLPLYITALPVIGIPELRGLCRRMVLKHGVKLIIIDYLQLIDPGKQENTEREISYISRNLKAINMELHVPLVALCQLRRLPPTVKDREPILADLRGSGSLEQDSDVVLFVYHHGKDDKSIIIGKHRGGRCGRVKMQFIEGRWEQSSYSKEGLPY
jgi:replicative DNA helicase